MKLLLLASVLCSILSYGVGFSWKIKKDNDTCLILEWTVNKMLLKATEGSASPEEQMIDAESGVVDSSSACAGNVTTLNVKYGNSKLILTFSKATDGMVFMDSTFTFIPNDYFQNNDNETKMVDLQGNVELSDEQYSYKCASNLTYTFTESSSTNNITYELELDVGAVQIQAFNILNDTFSDAKICAQDETVTTEVPATTEPPAQTTTPAPSTDKYFYPNNTDACVIVEGHFTMDITYTKTDDSSATVKTMIPGDVTVGGECPMAGDKSELSLSWDDNGAKRMISFSFTATGDEASLSSIAVVIDLDNATFPDAKENSTTVEKNVDIPLFAKSGYMSCKAAQESDLGNGVKVMYDNVKIKAFGVTDNDFSGDEYPCEADQEPPTAGNPPTNTYTVGDNKCIVFTGGIEFVIPYSRKDGKDEPATVGIPDIKKSTVTVDGTCGNSSQTMILKFYNNWSVSMIFGGGASTENGLLAATNEFYLQNVTLTYSLDEEKLFPQANETGSRTVKTDITTKDTFQGTPGQSYKCNKEQTVDFNGSVKMNTYNLQYTAYSTGNTTDFGDSPTECPSDSSTNSIVPIAVGAALAALVIIVLVAYLIGRRRSRTGYEQV